ncbi:MAG: membrane dipeptidase [Armatimonadetes bacterium]|nr:membrane dipeptidase [Armatimonadota bacterium]
MTPAAFLETHFFCDGHADTLRNVAMNGSDFIKGKGGNHVDLPRLSRAHQNLQVMAVFVPYIERGQQARNAAFRIAAQAYRAICRAEGRLTLVRSGETLEKCRRSSSMGLLLSLEGADPLMGELHLLEPFFRFGFRAIGLTHNHNSCAGGGCEPPDGVRMGLTAFGQRLIPRMEELGMVVDTAHLSRKAFSELMDRVTRPVVNSHCCCAHFVDIERNATDEQLRLIAQTGGLAAVTYVPKFLSGSDDDPVSSRDVFRHLEHMVEVAGIDHVALGSDFDGVSELPTDLRNPLEVENLVVHMIEAGWSSEDIARVVGGNWYRVLRAVLPVR